jgi:hypothetical protein
LLDESDTERNKRLSTVPFCLHFFFLNLVCEAIGTVATPGLLCQPRVIVKMIVEKQMECRFAGETEVQREKLPKAHFCPCLHLTFQADCIRPTDIK